PARLEAEQRAAVVDEVELDVAAAPQPLPGELALAARCAAAPGDERQVRLGDRAEAARGERQVGLPERAAGNSGRARRRGLARRRELVEEDAADAARLAAVREVEVLVAAALELVVERGVPRVALRLEH